MNPIYRFILYTDSYNRFYQYLPDYRLGVFMSSAGFVDNANYNTSGKLAVTPGEQLIVSNVYTARFFDANDNALTYAANQNQQMYLTAPTKAAYLRVCVHVSYWSALTVYGMRETKPVYKDDLAKEYELETNQRFYRAKLSGKISFIRQDYDYIMSQNFESQFYFLMGKSNDGGQTWDDEYYRGKFFMTDCEFDDDNKKCTVQPDTLDEYNDVLAGLEKEYNLITLAPEITRLSFKKRPLIQVYIPGDSVVSCFLGGTYWEQDANVVDDRNALVQTYHFALCNLLKEINVTGSSNPNVNGLYVGRMSISGTNQFTGNLYPSGGTSGYYIRASQQYQPPFWGLITYEIVRSSDNVVLFRYTNVSPGNQPFDNVEFDFTAVSGSGSSGTPHAEMATYNIYVRYLLDVETISGLNTYPLPSDDIVENNRNYHRAIGYAIDVAYISNSFSTTPTEYGLAGNGQYFYPPYSIWGQKFFPIARSTWRYASIWFGFAIFDWILEEQGRKEYTLRDAYPVASCIQVLLNQFAPGIKHEATAEYSQFLYGTDFIPIGYQRFTLLVSQKTNILVGDYDRPAQKAPTTLQQFTNMLRDCFRCFWYIEDGKFKIEHILWFRNGGSYSYNPALTVDLNTLLNVRNGKNWGFASSKWSFDKVDLAERYQFEWMDDVTQAFEGYPIEVISKFVTPGKIEEINVSNFTSDVDYMILNPGAISNDGFALFAAVKDNSNINTVGRQSDGYIDPNNGTFHANTPGALCYYATDYIPIAGGGSYFISYGHWTAFYDSNKNFIAGDNRTSTSGKEVTAPQNAYYMRTTGCTTADPMTIVRTDLVLPFSTFSMQGVDYVLQNYILSFMFLQATFYVYDLPARNVRINNNSAYAQGVERKKKQTVTYPSIDDPDPMKLVKTAIGNGQINKISITLHSRMNKVTLMYDTEQ